MPGTALENLVPEEQKLFQADNDLLGALIGWGKRQPSVQTDYSTVGTGSWRHHLYSLYCLWASFPHKKRDQEVCEPEELKQAPIHVLAS